MHVGRLARPTLAERLSKLGRLYPKGGPRFVRRSYAKRGKGLRG